MKIELSLQPSKQDLDAISKGINEFNADFLADDGCFDSGFRFTITAKNEHGELIGGLQASIVWSYCVLELMWLSKAARGKGLGSELIAELEKFAKAKKLSQLRTETLDFQAKPFYQKQGFEVYGELQDTPKGHTTYFLVKRL